MVQPHELDTMTREQLRALAKTRGVKLPRGRMSQPKSSSPCCATRRPSASAPESGGEEPPGGRVPHSAAVYGLWLSRDCRTISAP